MEFFLDWGLPAFILTSIAVSHFRFRREVKRLEENIKKADALIAEFDRREAEEISNEN